MSHSAAQAEPLFSPSHVAVLMQLMHACEMSPLVPPLALVPLATQSSTQLAPPELKPELGTLPDVDVSAKQSHTLVHA
ncbi:MAG: hypothetical protein H0V17_00110 [Deltaproteobacteria bacterium]|nr:hypothetical protein [Deltaproteobacteria bacterium]